MERDKRCIRHAVCVSGYWPPLGSAWVLQNSLFALGFTWKSQNTYHRKVVHIGNICQKPPSHWWIAHYGSVSRAVRSGTLMGGAGFRSSPPAVPEASKWKMPQSGMVNPYPVDCIRDPHVLD